MRMFKEHTGLDERIKQAIQAIRKAADKHSENRSRPILIVFRLDTTSQFGLYLIDENGHIQSSERINGVLAYFGRYTTQEDLFKAYRTLLEKQGGLAEQAIKIGIASNPSEVILWWVSIPEVVPKEHR